MKTSSAKAKGRKLQNDIVAYILATYLELTELDVRSTSMGAGGEDVQMSSKAKQLFPYQVECKNQEKFKGIYDIMDQAKGHGNYEPVAFIKMNRKEPLAIITAEHFFNLMSRLHGQQQTQNND